MKKITALFFCVLLTACAGQSLQSRQDNADSIAQDMTKDILQAGMFDLTVWKRIDAPNDMATIYIEGDGLAWLSKNKKSANPTPLHPLALQLAAKDTSANVIYLARPCQYSGLHGSNEACPDRYWTNARTAPEVIEAYNNLLSELKNMYHFSGFHLVGYSGGASVALLLAETRNDVLSLRTVAGNLDYTSFTELHHVSSLDLSLDPADRAASIAHVPQLHFIGGEDDIITPVLFTRWQQRSGSNTCIASHILGKATHHEGWAENWPTLLQMPVACH